MCKRCRILTGRLRYDEVWRKDKKEKTAGLRGEGERAGPIENE